MSVVPPASTHCRWSGEPVTSFVPFRFTTPADGVDDLRNRLRLARWADQIPGSGWDYGTDRDSLRDLCTAWADDYDFDAFEARCNRNDQLRGVIDGLDLHVIHARSPRLDAPPLVLLHGWPSSPFEFFDVIEPLRDAYHVIVPSLPGYGCSGPTTRRGVDAALIAGAIGAMLDELGYPKFLVHGGDWGSLVGTELARQFPDRVQALHLTILNCAPPPRDERDAGLTDADRADLAAAAEFQRTETGYQAIQSTKPQTLAYGLHDSPVGLAAWISEKFHTWADLDCGATGVPRERLLDTLSLYWFTGTIGSSMRLYFETLGGARSAAPVAVTVPVGHARYPAEIYKTPRAWAERALRIDRWIDMPRGGHFPALEVPELFLDDLREFFHPFTTAGSTP